MSSSATSFSAPFSSPSPSSSPSPTPEQIAFESLPWFTLHPVLVHLAALVGVYVASYRVLNIWRAVCTLAAQPTQTNYIPPPLPSPVFTLLKGHINAWRAQPLRTRTKRLSIGAFCFALWAGIQVFALYVVPRINSRNVQDVIFGFLLAALFVGPAYSLLDLAFPIPSRVRYRPIPSDPVPVTNEDTTTAASASASESETGSVPPADTAEPQLLLMHEDATVAFAIPSDLTARPHLTPGLKRRLLRYLYSTLIVVGMMVYSSYDHYVHLPLLAFALIFHFIPNFMATSRYKSMRVSTMISWVVGCLALAPIASLAIGLLIGAITSIFTSDEQPKEDDETKPKGTLPSDWIMVLLFTFGQLLTVAVPALSTAMTLRFEHSLTLNDAEVDNGPESDALLEQAPTDSQTAPEIGTPNHVQLAVVVPTTPPPSFKCPIFFSSLLSFVIGLAIVNSISIFVPDTIWLALTPVSLWIVVPVVYAGTALGAAWNGKLRQWWRYTEIWIPSSQNLRSIASTSISATAGQTSKSDDAEEVSYHQSHGEEEVKE